MKSARYLGPIVLVACACSAEDPSGPTFYEDVAPIFAKSCGSCHQPSGIGPFDISDYQSAREWAPLIDSSVSQRTMPPYLVTDDGSCGDYSGSGWLSDEEMDTIHRWANTGAAAGDPAKGPNFDVPVVTLGAADFRVGVPDFLPQVSATPGSEFDEYRCFLVDNESDVDRFITAFEGAPDNAGIVHHMTAYSVDLAQESHLAGVTNGDIVGALNGGGDGRAGWPCFGAAGDGVKHSGIPAVWAPGQGVVEYPKGVGYRLRPTEDIVLQVHYDFPDSSKLSVDSSSIGFRTAPKVERIAWFTAPDDFLLSYILYGYGVVDEHASLPAGEQSATFSFDYPAAAALHDGGFDPTSAPAFELLGVMPHMHELGSKQWLRIDPSGADMCAMEVREWDFDWQQFYFFDKGIPLTAASEMNITCEWDTRGRTKPVAPGWGTDSEMCLITMMFAVPFE